MRELTVCHLDTVVRKDWNGQHRATFVIVTYAGQNNTSTMKKISRVIARAKCQVLGGSTNTRRVSCKVGLFAKLGRFFWEVKQLTTPK